MFDAVYRTGFRFWWDRVGPPAWNKATVHPPAGLGLCATLPGANLFLSDADYEEYEHAEISRTANPTWEGGRDR